MTPLDLGPPVEASATCRVCHLDKRPLWAHGDLVCCASCMTRCRPERAITFRGATVVTAAQLTLL